MNKIELLPKNLEFEDTIYQLRMWVTFKGYLCIGYVNPFKPLNGSLFSVCVEPENEPRKIEDTIGYLNEYIGNAKTLDDACDMINEYINTHFINN